MAKKIILIIGILVVLAFLIMPAFSCGPSAEKIKQDLELSRAIRAGDSLDSICVHTIKIFGNYILIKPKA